MDPNNSTSCSKTIKDLFVKPQQLHNRELSRKILCNIPGLATDHIHDKKTCKDGPLKDSKRGEEHPKAHLTKSKDPSVNKLKNYLSEKALEPRFTTGKLLNSKKQLYVAFLDNNHFFNAKYSKMEREKAESNKLKGHQRHKSNLSLTKHVGLKVEGHQKNSSLVMSLLAKNLIMNRGKEEMNQIRNTNKNIAVQKKRGSCTKLTKLKEKSKEIRIEGNPDMVQTSERLPFFSNNNSPVQGSVKKVSIDSKDKNLLKKYFFNIQAIKKGKNDNKPNSLIENLKQPQRGLSAANKKQNFSTKRANDDNQSSRNQHQDPDLEDLFLYPIHQLSDSKKASAPKFNEIMKNIYKDKETKDVKNIKKMLQDHIKKLNKVPETSLHFYQVIKLLGKGSFGKVYLGLQRLTNRLVAIKCLEKSHFKDESTKRKILSEVKILKKLLGHPNVVKLLEVFENKKYVFFVTEYATNGDLLKYAKTHNFVEEHEAKYMFYQIAMGLSYIHQQNIIHRDVKLDNILVDEANRCKICDFGVSRQIDPKEMINEQCGTPAYLAPEIIKDEGYKGFGVDIWSLGVLLFCLLTGHMPFKASTIEELHKKILEGKYEFPENPKLTPEAMDLVSNMLVLDPGHRFTIGEVVRHDWVKSLNFETTTIKNIKEFERNQNNYLVEYKYEINDFALNHVCELGFTKELVEDSIVNKELNHASACYFNLEKDFV